MPSFRCQPTNLTVNKNSHTEACPWTIKTKLNKYPALSAYCDTWKNVLSPRKAYTRKDGTPVPEGTTTVNKTGNQPEAAVTALTKKSLTPTTTARGLLNAVRMSHIVAAVTVRPDLFSRPESAEAYKVVFSDGGALKLLSSDDPGEPAAWIVPAIPDTHRPITGAGEPCLTFDPTDPDSPTLTIAQLHKIRHLSEQLSGSENEILLPSTIPLHPRNNEDISQGYLTKIGGEYAWTPENETPDGSLHSFEGVMYSDNLSDVARILDTINRTQDPIRSEPGDPTLPTVIPLYMDAADARDGHPTSFAVDEIGGSYCLATTLPERYRHLFT